MTAKELGQENVFAYGSHDTSWNSGIDIRTHIAVAALQGILANPKTEHENEIRNATLAVRSADALLEQLAKDT